MKNFIYRIAFLFCMVTGLNFAFSGIAFSQTQEPKITERFLANPDDVMQIVEKSLNDNDVMGMLSYFPINYRISFRDMSMRLQSFSLGSHKFYLPGLSGLSRYREALDCSSFYIQTKTQILMAKMPELETSVPLKTEKESDELEAKIKAVLDSSKITITLIKRYDYTRPFIFKYSAGYLYECELFLDGTSISHPFFFVLKINNAWKLAAVTL